MRRTGVTDRLRASTYLLYANFVSVDGAMEESVSEFLVREEVTLDMKATARSFFTTLTARRSR